MSSPSFCLLPWASLAVRNNGDARVCCHAHSSKDEGLIRDEQGQILRAGKQDLDQIRNAESLKAIRRQMLEGVWPSACGRCLSEEKTGVQSKRIYSREHFPEEWDENWARKQTDSEGKIKTDQIPLVDLDLRFGNKCNLACRMCGPQDSSGWYADQVALDGPRFLDSHGLVQLKEKRPGVWMAEKGAYDWHESPQFWEELKSRGAELRHLYLVGGEPLLIEEHFTFLEYLVENSWSQNIVLEYNTNLTVLPDRVSQLWTKFRQVRLGISWDGAGAINDYIRYPSRFPLLHQNLKKVDGRPNIKAWLALTCSIFNVLHLIPSMVWVEEQGFSNLGKSTHRPYFHLHQVYRPLELNLQALPLPAKEKVERALKNQWADMSGRLDLPRRESAWKMIEGVCRHMHLRDESSYWPDFLDRTKQLDELRRQDFFSLNPEFSEFQLS